MKIYHFIIGKTCFRLLYHATLCRKLQNLDGKSFEACLLGTPQFRNPDGLRVLCSRFGIPRASACSLLLSVAKYAFFHPFFSISLRFFEQLSCLIKNQSSETGNGLRTSACTALQHVDEAVSFFRIRPIHNLAFSAWHKALGTSKTVGILKRSSVTILPSKWRIIMPMPTLLAVLCEPQSVSPLSYFLNPLFEPIFLRLGTRLSAHMSRPSTIWRRA